MATMIPQLYYIMTQNDQTIMCSHCVSAQVNLFLSTCTLHTSKQEFQLDRIVDSSVLWTVSYCGQYRIVDSIVLWTVSYCGQYRIVDSIVLWTVSYCRQYRIVCKLFVSIASVGCNAVTDEFQKLDFRLRTNNRQL